MMNYQLHKSNNSEGSAAEVWIDNVAGLCKKYYKLNSITVSGQITLHDKHKIKQFYDNEVYWSKKLESDWIPKLVEDGETDGGYYIIQEYFGPDLMTYYKEKTLYEHFPDIEMQTVEMFKFFSKNNVYKFNNSLSNMTSKNGKIMAFDFKYAQHRKIETRKIELQSIDLWVSKIEKNIKEKLKVYI